MTLKRTFFLVKFATQLCNQRIEIKDRMKYGANPRNRKEKGSITPQDRSGRHAARTS